MKYAARVVVAPHNGRSVPKVDVLRRRRHSSLVAGRRQWVVAGERAEPPKTTASFSWMSLTAAPQKNTFSFAFHHTTRALSTIEKPQQHQLDDPKQIITASVDDKDDHEEEDGDGEDEDRPYSDYDDSDDYNSSNDGDGDDNFLERKSRGSGSKDTETASFDVDDDDDDSPLTRQIWLDPKSPIKDRVNRFVNSPLGAMHHLDMKLSSLDLIRDCGKMRSFEGMKLAQDILDRLIEEKRHVNANTWPLIVVPDKPFQNVMYGWSNLARSVPFAPQRMREVLDLMIQEATYDVETRERVLEERSKDPGNNFPPASVDDATDNLYDGISCEPTVATYNTLLQGLSQAATKSIQAAIEAEGVLSAMDKMHRIRSWHTKPNTRSYSLVLGAYAKCIHDTAGERAERVLRDMIHRHEEEMVVYKDDYDADYDLLYPKNNRRQIVTPDVVAYTSVIQAYGNSRKPGSAERALLLLSEIIHSENPAVQVDAFAFASTINVYAKMAAKKASPESRNEAAMRAEEIWWLYVEELKKIGPDHSDQSSSINGSIIPFNAALKAIAASFTDKSPHQAEELLFKLLDRDLQDNVSLRPDTVSFNTVMQAWANASKVEKSIGPGRAEEILNLLKASANNDDPTRRIYPNIQSYVTTMNAYALSRRTDGVIHVHRLLTELLGEAREKFHLDLKDMNAAPFTVLLKAVVKANRTTKEQTSTATDDPFGLETNDDDGGSSDPYAMALGTYESLKCDVYGLGVQLDHFTFSVMLDVVHAHTDPDSVERRQRLHEIFEDACQAGQVSSLVILSLQKACPNKVLLNQILQLPPHIESVASIESINVFQRNWTRFVPPQFRRVKTRKEKFRSTSTHTRKTTNSHGNPKQKISNRDGRPQKARPTKRSDDFIF